MYPGCYPEKPCPVVGATCAAGTCAYKALLPLAPSAIVPATSSTKEQYPYQYGVRRDCSNVCPANFFDAVEIQRREACDPLCDIVTLAVGIDACASVINWYINRTLVLTHVGIGRRMSEEFRLRENGGYAEDVRINRVLIDFGTGTLLDASLPNNYSRIRVKDDVTDMSALVPLQDDLSSKDSNYYNPYHAKLGGLQPVIRAEYFAVQDNSEKYRLFGQGNVMKIRDIVVLQRRTFPDYKLPRIVCRRSCNPCQTGNCGADADCDSFDDWCSEVDARNFTVQQVQTNALGYPYGNANNPAGFGGNGGLVYPANYGSGSNTNLIITSVPANKRFWSPDCSGLGVGVSPYL